ncbi:hypothetical protein CFOL_v3_01070, partial [Cephalotus follicularis]
TLIGSIISALSQVKSHATPGSALITTSQGKFSNSFDLNWAQAASSIEACHCVHHMSNSLKQVVAELISLPSPASTLRDVLLRGLKVKGGEVVKMGIVDATHDSPEMLQEASVRMGKQITLRKWDDDVYAEIRKSLYHELLALLGLPTKVNASPRL